MRRRKMTMKRAINYIRKYEAEKYDDYDRRDKLTYRERTANEHARYVLNDLIKELEKQDSKPALVDENAKIDLAGEKEKADVRVIGNGEVSEEIVHRSRTGLTEKVPEVHTELSETGTAEASEG